MISNFVPSSVASAGSFMSSFISITSSFIIRGRIIVGLDGDFECKYPRLALTAPVLAKVFDKYSGFPFGCVIYPGRFNVPIDSLFINTFDVFRSSFLL